MAADALETTVVRQDLAVAEAVLELPLEDLDRVLSILKRHARREDLCVFLIRRIAGAPVADIEVLKSIYIRHFTWRELDGTPAQPHGGGS